MATNVEGANLRSGIVALLTGRRSRDADLAVLEMDELAMPTMLPSFDHPIVVLLNLSRDQLDRFGEVRTVAARWRRSTRAQPATVVANADDPLVVWGTGSATDVTFVRVGLGWRLDAVSCPNCGERIEAHGDDWHCTGCSLHRPDGYVLDGNLLRDPDGVTVVELRPGVPGRHNVANAALAVVAATAARGRAGDGGRCARRRPLRLGALPDRSHRRLDRCGSCWRRIRPAGASCSR